LLDGHLLIVAESGELVAVEATPAEYREKARVKILDTQSFTPVSFAHGHLFVRNLEQMARVKITAQKTLAAAPTAELRGAFGTFVAGLQQADDKNAKLDAFFAEHTRFPIIEDDGLVHFVFRGEVDDIALSLGSELQVPLTRVAGTDFYFHSTELDPAGYWPYNFASYDEPRLDPLNPLTIGVEPRIRNELRMPRWPAPDYFTEPGGERGRLDTFSFTSTVREGDREITVWLPPGYDAGDRRFPLWVVVQGDDALAIAQMDVALDNLTGTAVAPMVVAFVPTEGSEMWGDDRDGFVRLLADELVPHLEETYRIQKAPGARGIMGVFAGANIATYAALTRPTSFGKLSVQSFVYMGYADDLKELIAKADPAQVAAHVTISSHDFNRPGMDAAADARDLGDLLRGRGVAVQELAASGSPGWGSWRAQFGSILAWFAPVGGE
jgi:enterochelin esterase-like enzyme